MGAACPAPVPKTSNVATNTVDDQRVKMFLSLTLNFMGIVTAQNQMLISTFDAIAKSDKTESLPQLFVVNL